MDGILILDKPKGLTSHDCVNKARRAFHTRKVGHAGTLDPEASGVLVLAINQATKILEFLNQDDKVYTFTIRFNETTDTLDHTGTTTQRNLHAPIEGLDAILKTFKGTYFQSPPAYSAVKVKGKKLYEYAREGQPIPPVAKRPITVYALTRESGVYSEAGLHDVTCKVHASKGFYVRQLAADIASKLGTIAHTIMIRREQAGMFSLARSVSLEALQNGDAPLLSIHDALSHLPLISPDAPMREAVRHGRKLTLNSDASLVRIATNGALYAIYRKEEGSLFRAKKVFHSGGPS